MTTQNTHAAPDLAGLTDYTAQKWNIAAQKYRENRTCDNYAEAVDAQREHERAVQMAKTPALYAAAPELLAALEWAATFAEGSRDARPELNNAVFNAHIARARAALAKAKGGA